MRDYIRTLETEAKIKRENSEGIIERLKEFTCMTLRLQGSALTDALTWETSLTRAITASANEHINFQRAVQGQRVLFMPHSPGIYIALVLKQVTDIEYDNCGDGAGKEGGLKGSSSTSSLMKSESSSGAAVGSVKRLTIRNNLFLDVNSLSKSLQTILTSY